MFQKKSSYTNTIRIYVLSQSEAWATPKTLDLYVLNDRPSLLDGTRFLLLDGSRIDGLVTVEFPGLCIVYTTCKNLFEGKILIRFVRSFVRLLLTRDNVS